MRLTACQCDCCRRYIILHNATLLKCGVQAELQASQSHCSRVEAILQPMDTFIVPYVIHMLSRQAA